MWLLGSNVGYKKDNYINTVTKYWKNCFKVYDICYTTRNTIPHAIEHQQIISHNISSFPKIFGSLI